MADFINVTTQMFFDRVKVIAAMDNKSQRVLGSTGAFSRRVMQRGMRYRKGISKPGDYPSAHRGNALLRQKIFFGFSLPAQELVVGPTLLNLGGKGVDRELRNFANGRARFGLSTKTVPQLINEGGTVIRQRLVGRGRNTRKVGESIRQVYRARPFVSLTMPAAAKKLADNMERLELRAG